MTRAVLVALAVVIVGVAVAIMSTVVHGEVLRGSRSLGQSQPLQLVYAATRREDTALLTEKLGHQVLDVAPLQFEQRVHKVAVHKYLEWYLEAVVYFVETERFPDVFMSVPSHRGGASRAP